MNVRRPFAPSIASHVAILAFSVAACRSAEMSSLMTYEGRASPEEVEALWTEPWKWPFADDVVVYVSESHYSGHFDYDFVITTDGCMSIATTDGIVESRTIDARAIAKVLEAFRSRGFESMPETYFDQRYDDYGSYVIYRNVDGARKRVRADGSDPAAAPVLALIDDVDKIVGHQSWREQILDAASRSR